jgi:UDP-N-acetylglucosamine--N-acetylmuramyl-(pentapeptide) pyrophosphoryl-undecaprenol N-acetylglucosamine transferase
VEALLPALLDRAQVIHQAGPASANPDVVRLTRLRETWSPHHRARYTVVEFVGPELADIYAMADVVIARAGAGTVSELANAGLPSILIPLLGTWGDEQTKNALVLSRIGGAVVIAQPEATPERLKQELVSLLDDPARRLTMASAAKSIAQPDAAAKLVDELLALVDNGRG